MRARHGIQIQQDALIIVPIDASVMVGNILTILLQQSRFSATEPGSNWTRVKEMYNVSGGSRSSWFRTLLSPDPVLPGTQPVRDPNGADDFITANSLSDSRLVEKMSSMIKSMLSSMIAHPVPVTDWGMCVAQDLVSMKKDTGVTDAWGILPATGYRKVRYREAVHFPGAEDMFDIPHPISDAVNKLAYLMLRLDRFRLKLTLFKPGDVVDGIEIKERTFGAAHMWRALTDSLYAYFQLYRVSAMRLLRSPHARLRDTARALYVERVGAGYHSDIIKQDEAYESLFESVPVHPLVTYFEALFRTGDAETEVGRHPIHWIHTPDAGIARAKDALWPGVNEPLEYQVCGTEGKARLVELYENHLRAVVASPRVDPCVSGDWGWAEQKEAPTPYSFISLSGFASALRSLKDLPERMKSIASGLNWSTIPAKVGIVDLHSCDFALTDGERCTDEPDQVATGITPLLSLGNLKATPMTFVYERNFRPYEQGLFALPINGRVDILTSREHLERKYMYFSMTMGEPGILAVSPIQIRSSDDPVASAMLDHFKAKSSLYMQPYYPAYSIIPPRSNVFQSPWDLVGHAESQSAMETMESQWIATLAERHGAPAEEATLAERVGGKLFLGRALVAFARGTTFLVMTPKGVPAMEITPEGPYTAGDDEISLSYDLTSLDKLMNAMAPVQTANPHTPLTVNEMSRG